MSDITVEVIYATLETQTLLVLQVPYAITVQEVIELSGILLKHPEIQLTGDEANRVGIWSKPCLLTDTVKSNNRVEIYRPLHCSALEARKLRAKGIHSRPINK